MDQKQLEAQAKGEHGTCPTVRVKDGDSYAIINESDFDKSKHELYVEPKAEQQSAEGGAQEGGAQEQKRTKGKK